MIYIIGGGITGRLAQRVWSEAVILDWQSEDQASKLTRLYGTNYLWEPLPGISCAPFPVSTRIDGQPPTLASIVAYKKKVGKLHDGGDWEAQFQAETLGWDFRDPIIPPPSHVRYQTRVTQVCPPDRTLTVTSPDTGNRPVTLAYTTLISTIPQYALLNMIVPRPRTVPVYQFAPIYVEVEPLHPVGWEPSDHERLIVNYLSDPGILPYRYADRRGFRHYESLIPTLRGARKLIPGKIYPCAEADAVLSWCQMFDIWLFGRYGAWRPDELVHETYRTMRSWPWAPAPSW